jgi:8-oxo-dGTP pyrophosphatase MutT (NUDIX family)
MKKKSQNSHAARLKVQVWIAAPDPRRPKSGWKVLLLKMRKDRGGYWQPVTGSVEEGERLAHAALREAVEETGLRFTSKPQSLAESFLFESRWDGLCEEHGFFLIARADSARELPKVQLDPKEHTDYEWEALSRAGRRLGFASNRRMLRALIRILRENGKAKTKR